MTEVNSTLGQNPTDMKEKDSTMPDAEPASVPTSITANGSTSENSEPTEDSIGSKESPVKKPPAKPMPTSDPKPPTPLTTEQQKKYDELLATAKTWDSYPSTTAKNAPSTPLTEADQQWLTKECLLRYLRATKWVVASASTRLLSTLTWRHEYGMSTGAINADHISIENESGKQVIFGYDNHGRPILMMNPSRQNTPRGERQIQHMFFMLERCIDLCPPGQETTAWLINFKETSSGESPTFAQGRNVLYVLQNHYPERLGRALLLNVPWFFWPFYKLVTPFIDPLTREKVKFNEDLRTHVPPQQLLMGYGGDVTFEYDHKAYWPAMNGLADEKKRMMTERWVQGGKRIGESEMYLKGGEEKCMRDQEAEMEMSDKMDKVEDPAPAEV
ncbi:hypothetical protein MMC25_003380 [Agyrium rufum]|nr:hypothetical protein [Agyrium rufum]